MNCNHCGSTRVYKNGFRKNESGLVQRYKCRDCKKYTKSELKPTTELPKVLLIDIETAPIKAYVWGLWKNNVGMNQVISDWFTLTWSAKWLFDSETYSNRLTGKEAKKQDDSRIIQNIWHFLDAADVVIAHNAVKFDIPKLNTRFLMHGLNPPSPYQIIDTLKVAKQQFGFSSNRLDYINERLGISRKIDTGGFELWSECMEGNDDSLVKMEEYNRNDVDILEETYLMLRSWIKSHPNMALFTEANSAICPTCGSTDISVCGNYTTSVNRYTSFRCSNCGGLSRARTTEMTKKNSTNILAPAAR